MSYFVANQISFSPKGKPTHFKVKWWDNNVVPRWNHRTNDIQLWYLFEEFDNWNIQYRWDSNLKLLFINKLVKKYSKRLIDDFNNEVINYKEDKKKYYIRKKCHTDNTWKTYIVKNTKNRVYSSQYEPPKKFNIYQAEKIIEFLNKEIFIIEEAII
jgi:hypothetical protein